jgi:hypothetical protein
VFLAALGAAEAKIDASFCEAIRIAREQKSIFLEKRAEGTYAEYRRQKASASGGREFRSSLVTFLQFLRFVQRLARGILRRSPRMGRFSVKGGFPRIIWVCVL